MKLDKKTENIISHLRDKYGSWGWVGQRAHDAVGINRILPLDFIVCCDYGRETEYYFNKKFISLEKLGYNRSNWSNEDLNNNFEGKLGNEFIQFLINSDTLLNVLCYRSINKLENLKEIYSNKLKIYAVSERLKHYFDNKIFFREKLTHLNLNTIPGRTTNLDITLYNCFKRELGLPFVIQFPYGSSGLNTYIINNPDKYRRLCEKNFNKQVNVLKFIYGYCLNVNGIIISQKRNFKVYSTYPSVQLTGLEECSNSSTTFCGNDYTASNDLDETMINKVSCITKTIGKWMGEVGYRGIFGLDFIVDKEKEEVFPIEINPRFQNSTSLFTILEIIEQNYGFLFLLHILEFLKQKDAYLREFCFNFPYEELMNKYQGSQIILHNYSHQTIVNREILPGVYEFSNNKLVYKGSGVSLIDCRKKDEILITCGVPFKNKIIEPSAPVCKIQTRERITSFDYRSLNPNISKVVKQVYNMLNLIKDENLFQRKIV